jgi:hypothetical protein
MANIKKTVAVENEAVEEKIIEKPKKIEIDKKQMVQIKNVTSGGLFYKSLRTGFTISMSEYGDVEWIEAEELITMRSSVPVFLTKPWLIIEDNDELVEYLGLKKMYEDIACAKELDNFFSLPIDEIKERLKIMPTGIKQTIGEKARQMIANETLDSIRLIKTLEEELHINLQE